jgi:ring-1,2-phenylacetyl-CoA epoxidase subunit PaaE
MFYNIKVQKVTRETPETVSVTLEIPENLKEHFKYKQGQYLTFKQTINAGEHRRSYSLSSSPVTDNNLQVAVKQVEGGKFSTWANSELKEGDVLETMTPMGNFFTEVTENQKKKYVLFGAGSGITPLLSIIKTILSVEKESEVVLVYGNRDNANIIFNSQLNQLVGSSNGRFKRIDVLSRENNADPLFNGRIGKEKCIEIDLKHEKILDANEFFLCGPEIMIVDIKDWLEANNISTGRIHFELFTTPVASAEKTIDPNIEVISKLKVIMDDEEFEFDLSSKGDTILDASVDAGIDVPYSCKGAVCCTCKAKIVEGSARMEMNYALDDKEVADGYVLTCQAHPTSEKCVVDYDVI